MISCSALLAVSCGSCIVSTTDITDSNAHSPREALRSCSNKAGITTAVKIPPNLANPVQIPRHVALTAVGNTSVVYTCVGE
jgi:hypothetical protein